MKPHPTTSFKQWLIPLTAALFFFYEFIQMLMPNSLRSDLMQAFTINATDLGILSSAYFWANIIFLFPAGIILDRYSTKRIILAALAVCIVGTLLFSQAMSFPAAIISRFMTGVGSAFCFLSCIRLATRWLPSNRLALASGLVVTMAFIGGAVAQTPLTWLIEMVGWRHAILVDGIVGMAFFIIIFFVVSDRPEHGDAIHRAELKQLHALGFWQSLRRSYFKWQNWLAGIYTNMMNLPIFILGGIWGGGFLMQTHHLERAQAATIDMFILIGALIGCPFAGWFSDFLLKRKLPMFLGTVLSMVILLMILYTNDLDFVTLALLYFAIGFFTSSQVISYPLVAESNPSILTATSVSVISFNAIAGGAVFQPLVGYLLNRNWNGDLQQGIQNFSMHDYRIAFSILPLGFIVAFIVTLFLRETYCRSTA